MCNDNQNKVLMHLKLGKAIQYALKYEVGLREYINEGLIPMQIHWTKRTISV